MGYNTVGSVYGLLYTGGAVGPTAAGAALAQSVVPQNSLWGQLTSGPTVGPVAAGQALATGDTSGDTVTNALLNPSANPLNLTPGTTPQPTDLVGWLTKNWMTVALVVSAIAIAPALIKKL
jgi:hypothetical protein